MNNPILYQGLGGLMIVFFLVMIYFFTKSWRWFHIVCVVFVFGVSIFLVRNTAAVYRTLNVWRSDLAKTLPQIQKLEEENYTLRYGKTDDVAQEVESLRLLRAKMGRITLDQGRVWRNCTPTAPQADGSITVNTVPARPAPAVPADPSAPPAAEARPEAPSPNRIQDQTVLYVFLELAPPAEAGLPEGRKVPYYYLGDFVTVATTDTTVTVKPLTPPGRADQFLMSNPGFTWALYETMPVDGHEFFTNDPDQKPNWNASAATEPIFGSVSPEVKQGIEAMFKWPRFRPDFFSSPAEFQTATERVQKSAEQYLKDGYAVTNKDEFDPELVWTKVRFLKEKKEAVDSGAKVSPFSPGVTDDFFDRSGMAEVAILQLGGEAAFKEGDVAIFPQDDAKQLIDTGFCKFEEYVYVRRLNDYGYLFRDFNQRFDKIADEQEKIERDLAELQVAQASVNTQIALANDEQAKLQQDLQRTRYEAAKIAEYLAALRQHWEQVRQRLSQLYNANLQLEEKLQRASQRRTESGTDQPAADAVAGR